MLNKHLTTGERNLLQIGREKLQHYHKTWLSNTQLYHHYEFHKPKGSYIRQLDLLRSGQLPFTQEHTQNACKALGGSCAYNCGCCYGDRGSYRMPGVLMHCLEECRCWTRRGRVYPTRVGDESKEAKHVLLVDYWHRNGVRK